MKNSIPSVGTEVRISSDDFTLSRDKRTHFCRIKFDEGSQTWTTVPERGLMVFLTKPLNKEDTYMRITAILPTGKGAYAEPVKH
jgi:hypothetical protein